MLVLCSDGVTEAHDAAGNEFGEGRVEAALPRVATLPPAGIVEAIARGASDFRGGGAPEDDLSIAVVRYRG
jgi:sigma-B regulation protein RsbU (phosphoserine phosphatase)